MDILKFINSRDIKEHLERINYEFNALEASWLVYQCSTATLAEKNEAWNWIINNMSDMEVMERPNCSYRSSLHNTLREYMAMNEDLLKQYEDSVEAVYTHEFVLNGHYVNIIGMGADNVYFDLESSDNAIRDIWGDCEEYKDKPRTYITAIKHFKNTECKIKVNYDSKCRIMSVDVGNINSDKSFELISQFFDGMWLDFPTPFEKGDIVHRFNDDPNGANDHDYCGGIIVLESLLPWNLKDEGTASLEKYLTGRCGDTSDMTVYGYFMREDGSIYNECTWTYMDFEYYRGAYTGLKRIYKALSNFIKGED